MGYYLGEAVAATLVYNPSTKIVQWSTTEPEAEVYMGGRLFARAPSGSQAAPWVTLGDSYLFELKSMTGAVLASVFIDTDGTVSGQTIYGGEIPPAPLARFAPPNGGSGRRGAAAATAPSWFEQSTDIFGTPVPNLAMVGGGGLLLLLLLARRKK